MSSPACALPKLLLLLLATAGAALANDPLPLKLAMELSPPRPEYETLIATVSVNGLHRGEFTVHRDQAGDYYASPADLAALGLADSGTAGRRTRIGDEEAVSLRSLGAVSFAFDEARLLLEMTFPTPRLQGRTFDLVPRRLEKVFQPREQTAFVNYRLSASDQSGPEPARVGLANEVAVRAGDVLLRNESALINGGGTTRGVRYATQLVYDRREDQQRLIVGDHTAASGELGSALALGGAGLSKLYQMTPYFIRQPLAGYAGSVSTPSQVEVRLGGVPVFREQVAPGPYEVKNLPKFAGDVQVVVRDALGREQVVGFPYYYADQSLRAGLHEYSYSVGALHENIGASNADYGAGVFSAFHRYGLSDEVTLGLRGEAARDLWNFGPTALYRDNRLGAFSAGAAAGGQGGRRGGAVALGHVYQGGRVGTHLNLRRYGDGYARAQDLIAPSDVRAEYGAGASLTGAGWGSLFLEYNVTQRRASTGLPTSTMASLGYSSRLAAGASLYATLSRTHEVRQATQLFIGLLVTLDRATTLNLNARGETDRKASYGAQISAAVPPGEGLGYRVGYDGTGSDASAANAYVQYNSRHASYVVDTVSTRQPGMHSDRYEVAVAGATAYAGGEWHATRQIDDSFVAVRLAAPLEGVRVYSNNQEVGRTDSDGRLVVPRVGSFYETQITIEEKDVPLEYSIGELRRVVAPPYRSGSLLVFDVQRLRAVEGVIRLADGPAENTRFSLHRDGREQQFVTGREGRYYIEDLAPGSYDGVLHAGERDCPFALHVPKSMDALTVLPQVNACE